MKGNYEEVGYQKAVWIAKGNSKYINEEKKSNCLNFSKISLNFFNIFRSDFKREKLVLQLAMNACAKNTFILLSWH